MASLVVLLLFQLSVATSALSECLNNSECRSHLVCKNERCVDPCQNFCGANANCETRNHVPTCTCAPGHTGDPLTNCRRFNLEEVCHPNPCGVNTLCEFDNDGPICRCEPGYLWSPIAGCRHECENNGECGPQMACIEFKCQNACSQCGLNTDCEVVQNHIPVCKCSRGYFGNPLFSCHPECTQHSDCPLGKPTCFNNSCKNPCDGVCGISANCELRNGITPVCSCPSDMTGDPFVMCRFINNDLCEPNPCGTNAKCQPGYDKYFKKRPVCTCHAGYTGDPLYSCTRAECVDNSECRSHLVCKNESCVDPCHKFCGIDSNCETKNHAPICTCSPGYTGNPYTNCRLFNPEELCHPSPCGENTLSEVVKNVPTCKCQPGYYGSPIAGCHHECENNAECGPQMACIGFRCQIRCSQCGLNANCEGYFGDPLSVCQPECIYDSDCPLGKPTCFNNSCKNPCDGVCGIAANCDLRNGIIPVCSCPKNMTGDPFVMCRPFTNEDLCKPNPCGVNANCEPGHDRYNNERLVCTCRAGYIGDPIKGCLRKRIGDNKFPDH